MGECKLLWGCLESTIKGGLDQSAVDVDRCTADEGHLVMFDRDKHLWKGKVFRRDDTVNGIPIYVWGM